MHVQVHGNLVVIHAFVLINASVNIILEKNERIVQTTKLIRPLTVYVGWGYFEIEP